MCAFIVSWSNSCGMASLLCIQCAPRRCSSQSQPMYLGITRACADERSAVWHGTMDAVVHGEHTSFTHTLRELGTMAA
jgi:hypothetical protein